MTTHETPCPYSPPDQGLMCTRVESGTIVDKGCVITPQYERIEISEETAKQLGEKGFSTSVQRTVITRWEEGTEQYSGTNVTATWRICENMRQANQETISKVEIKGN